MTFYNDEFIIVVDSLNNIYMFQWKNQCLNLFIFNYITQEVEKRVIAEGSLEEYDVSIDDLDNIYIVYQDTNYNLILIILTDNNLERIELTEKSVPLVKNLNILNYGEDFHIIYCVAVLNNTNTYGIYHHLYSDENWLTNKVDEIKVLELLNPFQIATKSNKVFISYYDYKDKEEIYLKHFNCKERKWEETIQLTSGGKFKLYLDLLIINDKINLVYSEEDDGNFVVKYERFSIKKGHINKEIEDTMSNPENCSYPTIIYYDNKIWIVWLEYNNILSRFSENMGESWSPIYLWNESKKEDIIKYKYMNIKDKDNRILNSSFGKMYPDISFIGFGPLDNVKEVPLKKNLIIEPKWF